MAEKATTIKFWIILFFFPGFGFSSVAQDLIRARKNLEKLSSPSFAGRGYLEGGHKKAARFLQKSFKKLGLSPLNGSYYQEFTIEQNVFPRDPELILNGRRLTTGKDYLPAPECPETAGQFRIFRWDSLGVPGNASAQTGKAWLFDKKTLKQWKNSGTAGSATPGLFLQSEDKLTHSLAVAPEFPPRILIKKESLLPTDSVLDVRIYSKSSRITTRNVIGVVKGTRFPDSLLVVCAHYDHLGKIGRSTLFPGAGDNASGTAFMLELAAWFSKNPLQYSVLFIAFSAEEAGLLGSRYFVQHPPVPLGNIRFVMNLDLIGFGDKGATVVNGTVHEKEFGRLQAINRSKGYLPVINARGRAANSDHFPFSEKGVPAFFLYTLGGPGHYHDIYDKADTVTLSGFPAVFGLIRDFLQGFFPEANL